MSSVSTLDWGPTEKAKVKTTHDTVSKKRAEVSLVCGVSGIIRVRMHRSRWFTNLLGRHVLLVLGHRDRLQETGY